MNADNKGHDAYDHLEAGFGIEEFLIDDEPYEGPVGVDRGELDAPEASRELETELNSYRLLTVPEVFRRPNPSWVVEGIIPEQSLVMVYGPASAGKTFVTLDLALSVATGVGEWLGQGCGTGRVLYVLAEGQHGLGLRLRAWGVSENDSLGNLLFRADRFPLDDVERVSGLCEYLETEYRHFELVVFDTLSRNFDGDENVQRDAAQLVGACDLIRQRLGATVILVHHTGKVGGVERGSSVFRGAADTMIKVSKKGEGTVVLACEKQKDGPEFDSIVAGLDVVELGDGRSSCRLNFSGRCRTSLPEKQTLILEFLRTEKPEKMRRCDIQRGTGIAKQTVSSSCKTLLARGLIREVDARLTITDAGCEALTKSPMVPLRPVPLDATSPSNHRGL